MEAQRSVLLFCLLSVSFTSIVGSTEEQERDRISALPGQPAVAFSQYSGYITVNEQHGRALFYWLTEATSNPQSRPLLLWLNGAGDALAFLVRWLSRFPQYKYRDFYIAGESYAVTDNYHDTVGTVAFWWYHSIISDPTYKSILKNCNFKSDNLSQQCNDVINYATNHEFGSIDPYSIYTPACSTSTTNHTSLRLKNTLVRPRQVLSGYDPCSENYAENNDLFNNWQDSQFSMLHTYKKLMAAGLKIWVYSGDTDSVVPVTATRFSLSHLNLTVKTAWYPWYSGSQVGGWTEVYKGLTFATVRGAGHEVPLFQPRRAFLLFQSFLQGRELPKSP
ncbi:hypothetical protein RHMOL_Rhmol03G0283300 [Rhododendron molle]|uniref:Uncharacterized protein n=1 Tax=Rhododendron molle TaxID=49168 RepID=A0ACC0PLP5_RHOML|nr:hypothetical protein RHMOL_Rhmol03G0283300 [Rhododendron molle]